MVCTGSTLKPTFLLTLPALAFLVVVIGAATAGDDTARDVGPKDAQALIRENAGNRDFVVLDVRTPEEFAKGTSKAPCWSITVPPGYGRRWRA